MKIISKAMAVVMSAFVILSCSAPAASAKQMKLPQIKVVRCEGSSCANNSFLKMLQKSCNDCLNDILSAFNSLCREKNICVPVPCIPETEPTEPAPVDPTEKPTDAAAPTEPKPVPTEKDEAPTAQPTEPVTVPTEPEDAPSEPVVYPTEPEEKPADLEPTELTDPSQFNAEYEAEVLRLVNIERERYALSPLTADDGATMVARLRSKEIVKNFSHTRPDGRSCFTAASELGVKYRSAGENIAYGYRTPEQVVTGWMNSDGHRRNILSSSFSRLGIGCYEYGGVLYWSQFFIG